MKDILLIPLWQLTGGQLMKLICPVIELLLYIFMIWAVFKIMMHAFK